MNRRQSSALAAAVARLQNCDWRELVIHPRAPWRWLAPRLLSGVSIGLGTDFAALRQSAQSGSSPALVIGCGRQAALATRSLRLAGARCVQILDPRITGDQYDLVIAPAHDRLHGDNVITTLGSLNPVNADWLTQARVRFPHFQQLPSPRIVLALGGSSSAFTLDEAAFERLAAAITALLRHSGGSLLLTTSRRSPEWLIVAARRRFAGISGQQWFSDAAHADNPYPGFLAHADLIVATPDSVNLLSEAAAVGVPLLCPRWQPLRGKLEVFCTALQQRNLLQALPDANDEPAQRRVLDALAATDARSEPLRETDDVAQQIVQRLLRSSR